MALRARHEALSHRLADAFSISVEKCKSGVKAQIDLLDGLLGGSGPPCLLVSLEVKHCVS
jgi:hypothetical protein